MRSVTEFPNHKLVQGLNTRNTMTAEGKTPEEVQANLGTAFKLEGDKLKYFFNAIEVAGQNLEGLTRVLVVAFNEGESVPNKALKVEELHYVPEFVTGVQASTTVKKDQRGGPGKGKRDGPKESPWGLSPEQKAAKKGKAAKAKATP